MLQQLFYNEASLVTGSVVSALLGSLLTECLASRQAELLSEMLCWTMLLVMFKTTPRHSNHDRSLPAVSSSTRHSIRLGSIWLHIVLWFIAVCLAVVCVFKAEYGMVVFIPALTPLLLFVEWQLGSGYSKSSSWFSPIANSFWGTTAIAFFAIGSLVDWDIRGHVPAIGPAFGLLLAFVLFIPRPDRPSRLSRFVPSLSVEDAIVPLSWRIIILLAIVTGVETYVFQFAFLRIDAVAVFTLGTAKALFWYFGIQAVRSASSWRIATAMATFSLVSSRDPYMQSSDANALACVVASFLSLAEVVLLLPKEAKLKPTIWLFSLVPLVPFLANMATLSNPPSLLQGHEHPVEALMRNAKAGFEQMLQRQSQTFVAAHDEYRRRYGIEPPPGFGEWYTYAAEQRSQIIDEFDALHSSLAPFHELSGQEIRNVIQSAYNMPDSDLWLCTLSGSRLASTIRCTHPNRSFDRHVQRLFNSFLGPLPVGLPDVTFLVNHLDEPRVLLPPPGVTDAAPYGRLHHNVTSLERQPVWDVLTKHCPVEGGETAARDSALPGHKGAVDTFGIPFVTVPRSALDLCVHAEYGKMHGAVASPTSFPLIQGLVPVLSTGALSTMGDILYPSPAYTESGFKYNASQEIAWDKKSSTLYWAGSTTGAFATDGQWRHYHRQRFVAFAQNLEGREHAYLSDRRPGLNDGVISGARRVLSSFLNGRLYDVAFTRIFQCTPTQCRNERAFFRTRPWEPRDKALHARLVFDLDGNGISGRYYKLLASGSAPLKQTLLCEWHDERLVPWVHYFPVSASMEELPELVSYLMSNPKGGAGQRAARAVAEQGQDWSGKALRDTDMAIYTYRLLLELARLQDPDRPAGSAETKNTTRSQG